MPSYVTPKRATEFIFSIVLYDSDGDPVTDPTISAGDFLVSTDFGATSNLDTLPAVTPSGSTQVKVTVSAAEMTGDNVLVMAEDPDGTWEPVSIAIQTTANQIDDLALTGADADTLEDLSNQMDGVTVSVQAATATVSSGTTINVYRGTTWIITIEGLGNISAYDTIFFTVKGSPDDSDADAVLKVYNDASGLLIWNKATATAAQGKIVVDDATAGDITITIQEEATVSAILRTGLTYDVKGIDDNGSVVMLSAGGQFNVLGDVTRAIVSP